MISKKNTLLLVLICLGIFAIITSLYFKYALPHFQNLTAQKNDQRRIQDIDLLSSYLTEIIDTQNKASTTTVGVGRDKKIISIDSFSLGNPNVIYISLPSTKTDCSDIDLPPAPINWRYNCVKQESLQNIDGTGWIPVNFSSHTSGTLTHLPVDPSNSPDTLNYYSFVTNNVGFQKAQFAITAVINTKEYLRNAALTDEGVDTIRYEKGNDGDLWSRAQGITGYWKFKNDHNLSASIINASGTKIENEQRVQTTTDCLVARCIRLNRNSNTLITSSTSSFSKKIDGAYSFLFKLTAAPAYNSTLYNPGTSRLDVNIEGKTGALFIWFQDKNGGKLVYKSLNSEFIDSKWHLIMVNKSKDQLKIYIDQINVASISVETLTQSDSEKTNISMIGMGNALHDNLTIGDLKQFNRSLSGNELTSIQDRIKNLTSK